jgi:hypothetical protein
LIYPAIYAIIFEEIVLDMTYVNIIFAVLGSLELDIIAFIGLVILGLIIIFLIRLLLILIPAALVAFVVWYLTGSLFWAGIAFLVIAALSILKKL